MDTSTVVSAVRSDAGASRRLLSACLAREAILLVSVPLLIEYQAVMTRPEHLERSTLSAGEIDALLDTIADIGEPVNLAFLLRPALRDPDDDMVLETAVNGGADAIVTFNVRDFADVRARFGIEVLSPGMAWRLLEARR